MAVGEMVGKTPPLSEILSLRLKGMTLQEIGDRFGVTNQAISKKIKGSLAILDGERLDAYRQHRVSILEAIEDRLCCEMVDPARMAKASLGNIAYGLTQVHTARRLEAGQSTQNISLRVMVGDICRKAQGKQTLTDKADQNAPE